MYSILIVDDEEIIRRGLRETIDWNAMGFELIGEGENGEHGLALIEELRPNVVMTDIRMPVMNGLDMLSAAVKKHPSAVYIILSGFEEFEYAKRGVELGVSNYISKLTLDSDVKEIFPAIKDRLDLEKKQEKSLDSIVKEREELRLERLFSDIMIGRISLSDDVTPFEEDTMQTEFLNALINAVRANDNERLQTLLNRLENRLLTQMIEPETFHSFASEFANVLSARMAEADETIKTANTDYDELYAFIKNSAFAAARSVHLSHGKPTKQAVERAKRYVKEHFCEKLTLSEVAKAVFLSPAYLSSVFSKECGMTLGSYITKLRMEKAKEYLKQGYSVSQTTQMVGYSDIKHFSKMFKEYYDGVSPSKYAKHDLEQGQNEESTGD
ncbi:putative transcriptional regulatory protein YesN [Clostridia bacterium]|nr:putative transcriptional regulatory protein YesN [Clostridia bacterium]